MNHKPSVALFSPMPPVPSGISDYTADLLPFLSQRLELELWVDQPRIECAEASGIAVQRWSANAWRRRQSEYDLVVYQMGNSPAHSYMLDAMSIRPGLVVLHDLVLHHLMFWRAVMTGRSSAYIRDMTARYGEIGRRVAQEMLLGKSPLEAFKCPLSEDVVKASVGIACHSRYVASKIASIAGPKLVHHVPMGVPIPMPANKSLARRSLGLPDKATLGLSIGHVNPYKGMELVLRVVSRLANRLPDLRLVIAGSVSPQFPLDRLIGAYEAEASVIYLGRVSPDHLPILLSSVDFSFSLRYPTAGETSASLLRALSYGVPGLVTDVGAFSELPDGCCPKVPIGPEAEDVLEAYVCALVENQDLREAASMEARRFIASHHSLTHSANAYFDLIGRLLGSPIEPLEWPETAQHPQPAPSTPKAATPNLSGTVAPLLDDLAEVAVGLGWGSWPALPASVLAESFSDLFKHATGPEV